MKRTKRTAASRRRVDLSLLDLVVNPVSLMIGVTMLAIPLWNHQRENINNSGELRLSAEILHLNPSPEWVRLPVCQRVIEESRLNEIALDDPKCLETVAAALATQSWIKSVNRLSKTPGGVRAKVSWREPVGTVEFADLQLVPIDESATVLEGEGLTSSDITNWWRISVPAPVTAGLATGRVWGDIRIQDAAAIAAAWEGEFRALGLARIVNRSEPTSDRARLQPYELWTARGTIVYWGSPPGKEKKGEAAAADKIEAVRSFVASNGPLDRGASVFLDVRDGVIRPADPKLAEQSSDFIKTLK